MRHHPHPHPHPIRGFAPGVSDSYRMQYAVARAQREKDNQAWLYEPEPFKPAQLKST